MIRAALVAFTLAVSVATGHAADKVTGKVTVGGKPIALTHGFVQPRHGDLRVILCDGVVPVGDVRADFDRQDLAEKGKVHCVENTINESNAVVSTTVLHDAFKMFPSAVSSWMLFEPGAKAAGRFRGRIRMTKEETSYLDKIPYTWDVTFDLALPK